MKEKHYSFTFINLVYHNTFQNYNIPIHNRNNFEEWSDIMSDHANFDLTNGLTCGKDEIVMRIVFH